MNVKQYKGCVNVTASFVVDSYLSICIHTKDEIRRCIWLMMMMMAKTNLRVLFFSSRGTNGNTEIKIVYCIPWIEMRENKIIEPTVHINSGFNFTLLDVCMYASRLGWSIVMYIFKFRVVFHTTSLSRGACASRGDYNCYTDDVMNDYTTSRCSDDVD